MLKCCLITYLRLTAGFFVLFFSGTTYAAGPSFDCSKAHKKDEIAICGDEELSSLEFESATKFKKFRIMAGTEKAAFIANSYLQKRFTCGGRSSCIRDVLIDAIDRYRWEIENIANQDSPSTKQQSTAPDMPPALVGSTPVKNRNPEINDEYDNYRHGGSTSWSDAQGVYNMTKQTFSATTTNSNGTVTHVETFPGGSIVNTTPPVSTSVGGEHWPRGFGH
jgi:uncharacterized protein